MVITGARPLVTVPDDADLEGVLAEWRAFRRRRRLSEVHWVDALYRVYLTAIVSGVAFLTAASFAGDEPAVLRPSELTNADDVLGVAVAAVLFVALRSGSRGGPLALETAEVRLGLSSPVDRVTALRGPALRQLRFFVFAAAVVGAMGGHLADRRLDGDGAAWLASGALAAAVTVALAHGAACTVAGLRVRPSFASVAGVLLVAWSAADAADVVRFAPTSLVGKIALWPLHWDPVGLVAVALVPVAVVVGLHLIGGTSLERLERRARLVGQIRFAATLQDLRTVIVLRRQLTQERARTKPWLRPPLPSSRLPVLSRDIRSLLRWPLGRVVRLGVIIGVAGLAARGAWEGTSPLIVVAGLALFLGGLDAAEPLGQEVDHPSRRDELPVPAGWIYLRHLPAVVAVSVALAAAAAVVAVLVDPQAGAVPVALACVLPAALGAAAGAVVNVLMGAPDPAGAGGAWSLAPPEAAGMRVAFRLVWPPALAIAGTIPILLARAAFEDGRPPAEAAAEGIAAAVSVFVMIAAWARHRDDIKSWWAGQLEQALPSGRPAAGRAGGAGDEGGRGG